jgi:outer membrane protein
MRNCTLLVLACVLQSAQAQTQKIGHADWIYIFNHMPEMKEVQSALKVYEAQLNTQLEAKQREWDVKYKAYQELPANTPEAIKKDKEGELSYLRENMRKFHLEAQQYVQKKESELMTPILTKIGKAIEAVARENGYAYIFNPQLNSNADVLLFGDEQYNISNLVLRKMGIAPALTEKE